MTNLLCSRQGELFTMKLPDEIKQLRVEIQKEGNALVKTFANDETFENLNPLMNLKMLMLSFVFFNKRAGYIEHIVQFALDEITKIQSESKEITEEITGLTEIAVVLQEIHLDEAKQLTKRK